MTRVLLVSNGHGEDTIGAAVARELCLAGLEVAAVPLVGQGKAYRDSGFEVLGPGRDLPSGGYLLAGFGSLWTDLRAGFVGTTLEQWRAVRRAAGKSDACLAIGDWYAVATAATFAHRPLFHLQPAVSVRAWPPGAPAWKAPFGPLERLLMRRCAAVYPRDGDSARWLRSRGLTNVHDLGNPMLDAVAGSAPLTEAPPYLLLLPGSRGDAGYSLPLMLEACRELRDLGLAPVIAWGGDRPPPVPSGWVSSPTGESAGVTHRFLHRDGTTAALACGSFAAALAGASLALSTSGTAAEQCAGRGVPLISFPTPGPQYTVRFAAAQKRALGDALTVVKPSAAAVAAAARELLNDPQRRERAVRDGREVMGEPGAAARIAAHLVRLLKHAAPVSISP